jgi:hypothetical protein
MADVPVHVSRSADVAKQAAQGAAPIADGPAVDQRRLSTRCASARRGTTDHLWRNRSGGRRTGLGSSDTTINAGRSELGREDGFPRVLCAYVVFAAGVESLMPQRPPWCLDACGRGISVPASP